MYLFFSPLFLSKFLHNDILVHVAAIYGKKKPEIIISGFFIILFKININFDQALSFSVDTIFLSILAFESCLFKASDF